MKRSGRAGTPLAQNAELSMTLDEMTTHVENEPIPPSHLSAPDQDMSTADMERMVENARRASNFLKAISHEGRLMILCHLASGEKSVTELEQLLSARQAAVSQQLTRLRMEGLVTPRREGKTIYYSLAGDRPKRIMEVMYDLFCRQD